MANTLTKQNNYNFSGFLFLAILFQSCSIAPAAENNPDWQLVWQDDFNSAVIDPEYYEFDLGTGASQFTEYGLQNSGLVPESFESDQFSVRWSGYIQADETASYTLYIVADDGVRFFHDDTLLIDGWIPQAPTEYSASVHLIAGEPYTIVLEYFEESGGETLILGWESNSIPKSVIPETNLHTMDGRNGLLGEYFPNTDLFVLGSHSEFKRVDPDLNWSSGNGWGNHELQYYTNRQKNIRIENGRLIIEAHLEDYLGSNYTSARLKTRMGWKYGKFEFKAKMPNGTGTWGAIWGLPTEWYYGNWPGSGEIDIVEYVGFQPGDIFASVHNLALSGNLYQSDQQAFFHINDADNSDHIYSMEWDEDQITMSVDHQKYFIFNKNGRDWVFWPFDREFRVLMNLAVGGSWGGMHGIDNSVFPARMEIDYIRVYQKKQ